jgi:hypothetical protein
MRRQDSALQIALYAMLGALALGGAGCSRFKGSGDDDKPAAKPSPVVTATPAVTATATATTLAPGVYTVNKPLETDEDAVITTVTIEADTTKLEITFTNRGKAASQLMVAKPGSKEALFLEQPDGKKISLRSSSGIAVQPAQTTVAPGGTAKLSAVFGPLDPGVRKFSLFEGEAAKTSMPGETTYWIVHDVEIK